MHTSASPKNTRMESPRFIPLITQGDPWRTALASSFSGITTQAKPGHEEPVEEDVHGEEHEVACFFTTLIILLLLKTTSKRVLEPRLKESNVVCAVKKIQNYM